MPTIVHSTLENLDGMLFTGKTNSGHEVKMDAMPAVNGTDTAARPAELPFVGLSGCTGMDVISVLRKMRQPVTKFEIAVEGITKTEEYPKYWTEITVIFHVDGEVDSKKLEKAINLSRERYCGVSASLSGKVKINYAYVLNGERVDM